MEMLLRSAVYFIKHLFFKKEYDVIFYYPQHFNRGEDQENQYFKNLIRTCQKHRLRYLIFEEPDRFSNCNRNSFSIPFDFIFYLILILRKVYYFKFGVRVIDKRIGGFLSKTFFRGIIFKNIVTISQSMVSVFRGLNSTCFIFDVQHGIIHPNKPNYLMNRIPENNLKENDVNILFSGEAYQNLLINNDSTSFFKDHSFVIGNHINVGQNTYTKFNNNILVTLQFTQDHTPDENKLLLESLERLIVSEDRKNTFYLKHHPRFNNDVNLDKLLALINVNVAPADIQEAFKICSLHLTAYSTSVFEAALVGIPTLIINPIEKFNYFQKYFYYNSKYEIKDFSDAKFYLKQSEKVKAWAISYYSNYNHEDFLKLLR